MVTDRLQGLNIGVAVKPPCYVASTTSLTLSGAQTVDGISVGSCERVLVKDQNDPKLNGIYIAGTGSWSRAKDFDGARDAVPGTMVYVDRGNVYGRVFFAVNSSSTATEVVIAAYNSSDADDKIFSQITPSLTDVSAGTVQASGSTAERALDARFGEVANLRDHGAVGDGIANDTTAIQSWIADALGTVLEGGKSKRAYAPAGRYLYDNKWGTLTHAIKIVGDGPRSTLFICSTTFSGETLEVNETLFNGGYNDDLETVDLTLAKTGVNLEGFSIIGNRGSSSAQSGLLFSDRNDEVLIRDVYLQYLSGYGLKIGVLGSKTNAFMRESAFYNVQAIMCGSSTEPAITLQDDGAGDGTNQIDFYNLRLEFPQGVGLRVENNSTANPLRRINFFSFMCHADTSSPPATDLIEIVGLCKSVNIWGLKANGVGAANYTMVFDQNQSGNVPTDCIIKGAISSGGNGVWVKAGSDLDFDMQESAVTGNDLKVDDATHVSNSINYYSPTANTLTFDIDTASAPRVNGRWYRGADVPLKVQKVVVAEGAESPGAAFLAGQGSPEGVVTSGPGGLYLNRTGSAQRNSDSVYVKPQGSSNTLWVPLQEIRSGTTAQRSTDPTPYQQYFDTTLGIPVWYDSAAGHWVDATGSSST